MKYVLSLIFGIALGAIAAGALIFFNPLIRGQSAPPDSPEWELNYSLAAERLWLATHEDRLHIPVVPADVPLLFENGVKGSLMMAMPLQGGPGNESAVGTRISVPSSETELLLKGVIVEDHWLISVPGSGTVLVRSRNNYWPMLRDTLIRVDLLKRGFSGPGIYHPTRGPADRGAEVIGMTGALTDFRGQAHERMSLDSYSGSLGSLTGQLQIKSTESPD